MNLFTATPVPSGAMPDATCPNVPFANAASDAEYFPSVIRSAVGLEYPVAFTGIHDEPSCISKVLPRRILSLRNLCIQRHTNIRQN